MSLSAYRPKAWPCSCITPSAPHLTDSLHTHHCTPRLATVRVKRRDHLLKIRAGEHGAGALALLGHGAETDGHSRAVGLLCHEHDHLPDGFDPFLHLLLRLSGKYNRAAHWM